MTSSTVLNYAMGIFAFWTCVGVYGTWSTNQAKKRYLAALAREARAAEGAGTTGMIVSVELAQKMKLLGHPGTPSSDRVPA